MQEVSFPKMRLSRASGRRRGHSVQPLSRQGLRGGRVARPYSFFNVPVGAQDPDTGTAATAEDTNMDAASLLTAPNRFMAVKICVPIGPSTLTLIPVGSPLTARPKASKTT